MRNVAPSRALVRRSYQWLTVAFLVIAVAIFMAIFGLALYQIPLVSKSHDAYPFFNAGRGVLFVGGVILGGVGVGMAIRAVTWKVDNDVAKLLGDELSRHLDKQYALIRNINRRQLGYIDAVLLGPPGVLVFRVLNLKGKFLNEKAKWLKADKSGQWIPMRLNPSQQVIDDIKSLKQYLATKGLQDIPIFGAIVFIHDDPVVHLTLKEPAVLATHLSSLYRRLQVNYFAKERIDQKLVNQIFNELYEA